MQSASCDPQRSLMFWKIRELLLVLPNADEFRAAEFYRPLVGRLNGDDGKGQSVAFDIQHIQPIQHDPRFNSPQGLKEHARFQIWSASWGNADHCAQCG